MSLQTLVSPYTALVQATTEGGRGVVLHEDGTFSLTSGEEWFYAFDDVPVGAMVRVAASETAKFRRAGSDVTVYLRTRSGVARLDTAFAAPEAGGGGGGGGAPAGGGPICKFKTALTTRGAPNNGGAGTELIDPDLKFAAAANTSYHVEIAFECSSADTQSVLVKPIGPADGMLGLTTWLAQSAANAAPVQNTLDGYTADSMPSVAIPTAVGVNPDAGIAKAIVRLSFDIAVVTAGDVGLAWATNGFGVDGKVNSGSLIAVAAA